MLTASQHQGNAVRPYLKLDVIRQPHPDAKREAHQALDDLAEGLADLLLARARQEVARECGVAEDVIDREHGRVAEAARALSPLPVQASGRTGRRAEVRKARRVEDGNASFALHHRQYADRRT